MKQHLVECEGHIVVIYLSNQCCMTWYGSAVRVAMVLTCKKDVHYWLCHGGLTTPMKKESSGHTTLMSQLWLGGGPFWN